MILYILNSSLALLVILKVTQTLSKGEILLLVCSNTELISKPVYIGKVILNKFQIYSSVSDHPTAAHETPIYKTYLNPNCLAMLKTEQMIQERIQWGEL